MQPQQAIIFIFLRENNGKTEILFEERDFATKPHLLVPPGGTVKTEENEPLGDALVREIFEELGVIPEKYELLEIDEPLFSHSGKQLHPYVIEKWQGDIPDRVLDQGNPLRWENIRFFFESDLPITQKMATALKKKMNKKIHL